MIPKHLLFILSCTLSLTPYCQSDTSTKTEVYHMSEGEREALIDSIMVEVNKHSLYSKERQLALDGGLEIDSTIAYFWQQKAMPLFKQGKYEIGMEFLDKAVLYDERAYLDYRAFIKCIFSKTYRAALVDFDRCKKLYGNLYVMDHSYDFYRALCYLQLNEFQTAADIFSEDLSSVTTLRGEEVVHHLDLMYYGIALMELGEHAKAVELFDRALEKYPQFSDVQYYKAVCLGRMGDRQAASALIEQAKANGKIGYSINEDNVIYERYPYQVRWYW